MGFMLFSSRSLVTFYRSSLSVQPSRLEGSDLSFTVDIVDELIVVVEPRDGVIE